MSNPFTQFQAQIEELNQRCERGEISADERDDAARQLQLTDDTWGDMWMFSPQGQWFRKAAGSQQWMPDFPLALVDAAGLPPIAQMNLPQLALTIHGCQRCGLHQGRNRAVPGEGNPHADLMFIGEGPGKTEDQQARPFVGRSGNFLAQLLQEIGYTRKDVFITNVVKCRPPNNRDPQPDELTACQDFLERQIEVINPKVVVTLGRFSMYRYFPGAAISKIHGRPKRVNGRLIVPMFHPAAALRNPKWREAMVADFARLPELIKQVG